MFCQNCGTELKSDSVFCTNCGTRIESVNKPDMSQTPKQVTMGAVIGIVVGSVVLIAALFTFIGYLFVSQIINGPNTGDRVQRDPIIASPQNPSGIMLTPAPIPPTPPPLPAPDLVTPVPGPEQLPRPATVMIDNELEGSWEFVSGDWIWFFGQSDHVMFLEYFSDDEPVFGVYASEPDEWALCFFTEDRSLIVEAEDGYYFEFTWIVNEDILILIDSDNDMLQLIRYAN